MSTFSKRRRGSRLGVERLEDRLLLAGNVRAWVAGGDLILRGDDLANGVDISPGPDGGFVIAGTDQQGPTTVNGQSNPVTLKGVTDDVFLYLYGGDDFLRMDGWIDADQTPGELVIPGDLVVVTHAGNDTVELDWRVKVGNDARIYTRGGNDDVLISGTNVGDDLFVRNHSGEGRVAVWQSGVGDDVVIRTGDQSDEVSLGEMSVGDDLFVYTYGDTDYVWLVEMAVGDVTVISTGSGNDYVGIYNANLGNDLRTSLGSGDDYLGISGTSIGRHAFLFSHGGADTVGLTDTTVANYLCVNTGSGDDVVGLGPELYYFFGLGEGALRSEPNDYVEETGVTAKECRVVTGGGHDVLGVAASTFHQNLRLFTGSGDDAIYVTGTNVGNLFYADAGIGNDGVTIGAYLGYYDEYYENGYVDNGYYENGPGLDFGLKAKYAILHTGTGNDTAMLTDIVIEHYFYAFFLTGDDVADMADIATRSLMIYMGSGNDNLGLHLSNMQISRTFFAFGGPGNDFLRMYGYGKAPRYFSFESVIA